MTLPASGGVADCSKHVAIPIQRAPLEVLRKLFEIMAVGCMAAALGACGGGGEGAAPTPAPVPAPPPAPSPRPLPAQMSVPDPVGYDVDHLAAFNRINELRLAAGLGMLAQDTRLDRAAQGHANWEVANGQFSHLETADSPAFAGVNWWDRALVAGYTISGGAEVISYGDDPTSSVDYLMNIIYHRRALLEFDPVDVGIGWVATDELPVPEPLVVDFSSPLDNGARSGGQLSQSWANGVVIWPLDGATGVATHMGNEEPNPVSTLEVGALGTPASISTCKDCELRVGTFSILEEPGNAAVPSVQLARQSDPNGLIPKSFVALIPTNGLKVNTKYTVVFEGSIVPIGTSVSVPYERSWSFTTGGSAYPLATR
jgi:uncharacterized protein YkwD